jgi:hypothetical protein
MDWIVFLNTILWMFALNPIHPPAITKVVHNTSLDLIFAPTCKNWSLRVFRCGDLIEVEILKIAGHKEQKKT